ncbi:isoaspartyl peptidase/L-asparaginase [bacterium]|nr:MAG: isoaspartyl peptidase/L-asparaginase [bacterium]
MKLIKISITLGVFIFLSFSCMQSTRENMPKKQFAIAIHGGAGVISKNLPDSVRKNYEKGLQEALDLGKNLLEKGSPALDVVEQVIHVLENNPLFNAGKGAVFTAKGEHELDAAIMNGKTLATGAVAGVKTVKNPISLARKVMTETPHVLLMGAGAEEFADSQDITRVPNSYFDTENRRKQLERAQQKSAEILKSDTYGTVGCVVLDKDGNLAAGTSTGGMTNKKFGRVGDAPIIGAGTYANNETCAISATGTGEEFIRHTVTARISALFEYKNYSIEKASDYVIHKVLQPGDGGVICVDKFGNIAMPFNSAGMFRGAADSEGLFEVKIWE